MSTKKTIKKLSRLIFDPPTNTSHTIMKHLVMLLTAIAVFTCFAEAQNISDFSIRHFNTENGLQQNSIKAIAADEYGFIWMASETGLLRYDGRSFKIYNRKNTGTATSRILNIARIPQRKGLLAISDYGELLLIDKGRAKLHYKVNTAALQQPGYTAYSDSIVDMAFRNYYYMGSQALLLENNLSAILTLKDGIRWYKGNALISHTPLKPLDNFSSVFALGKFMFLSHDQLSAGTMTCFEPGRSRQILITGDFIKQAPNNKPGETFFITNHATKVVFLSSGSNLYLVSLRPDGNLYTRLLISGFGLLSHQICSVHYDSVGGHLFMGSGTEGLFMFTRKRFLTSLYPGKDPFKNVYYATVPLNDSSILTGSGLVHFTQKGSKPEYRALLKKPGNYGYELFRSAKRGIWFWHDKHLYQLDSAAHKITGKFEVSSVTAIAEHRNNDIWVASMGSGIYKINAEGHLSRMIASAKNALCIVWETDTTCWIGTDSYLFRYYTPSGKIDTFQALGHKVVRSIYIPRPDEVWICSYENGLYLWKDGRLTSFFSNEYPALQTVHKILEDGKGFFWISTNGGLYQVSRNDLLQRHNDPAYQPYYFRYGIEDGFLTNEFNGSRQHSGTMLGNGFFAFPSMKGIVFFKPEVTGPELPDKPIIIDRITVDGRERNPDQYPITIERGFEQITITPATAYLGNTVNLKYEFNLNNSTKWQALTGGSIVFSALSSGDNHITIRKRSGFGAKGYVYCSLDIYVPPAWWERTWFYLALLTLLILIFWLAVWLRTRYWRNRSQHLEEAVQNRTLELNDMILELERSEEKLSEQLHLQRLLNENITHDVNAPLKYLTIYTSEMLEQVKSNKLPDVNEVERIHDATQNIHKLVENLTLFLKSRYKNIAPSRINISKLVQQKLELFSMGAKKRNNLLRNDTDPDLFIHQNEILLGIMLHNLVDNAVKQTTKGTILITTQYEEKGVVCLRVKDTGRGMTEEQVLQYNDFFRSETPASNITSGFGFIIVKEIARILHLVITVKSMLNEGTEVTVIIPVNHSGNYSG